MLRRTTALIALICLTPASARGIEPGEIIRRTLAHDYWGLSGAQVEATALLVDRRGRTRTLAFKATSKKWKRHLTKSLVRFIQPPDLAGAGFLQIQNDDRDDDRFIYLPALKRARRVAASQRSTAFMGTDFNFSDIDRRDWRTGRYQAGPDVTIGRFPCHSVTVTPQRGDSPYSKVEIAVRKDNFVPLRVKLYDRSQTQIKTLDVFQVQRVQGQWFISKSRMTNHKEKRSTTLHLTKIVPGGDTPDSFFTVESLSR